MSCYQSATAIVRSGATGNVLIVSVKAYAGIVPPKIEKGKLPNDPADVFPVIVSGTVPISPSLVTLEITHNVKDKREFQFVEIFCGDVKPGTRLEVTMESGKGNQ